MIAENRNDFFDIIKGALIILVVFGHSIMLKIERYGWRSDYAAQGIMCWMYIFHMPLFIFISGYFSKDQLKMRNKAFKGLLIPYLIAQIAYGIYYAVAHHDYTYLANIFYPAMSMWYMLALFIWRILIPDLLRIKHILLLAMLLNLTTATFVGMDNTMALQRTVGFFIYFVLGYYADEALIEKIRMIPRSLAIVFLIVEIVIIVKIVYYMQGGDHIFKVFTHNVYISRFSDILLDVLVYFVAFVCSVITSCFFIAAMPRKNSGLSAIGRRSLFIYLPHSLFLIIYFDVLKWFSLDFSWIVTGVFGVGIIAICSSKIFSEFIEKGLCHISAWVMKK